MPSEIKRLFRHSGVYAVGNALSSAVLFFLLPVWTRVLSPAEFGILETLSPVLGILSMISALGFGSALLKTHERDAKTELERKELLGTALLFVVPFTTFVTLVLALFRNPLSEWLLDSADRSPFLLLVLVTNWLLVLVQLGLATLRTQERSTFFAIVTTLRAVFLLTLNLVLLLVFDLRVEGVLAAQLLVYVLMDLILLRSTLKSAKLSFSKPLFKRLAAFGVAVFPAQIAMWFMDLSDRFFLKESLSFDEVGIYSLAYRISTIVVVLLITPFQLAWPTVSYSVADQPTAKKMYARSLLLFVSGGVFLSAALSMFAPFLIRILGTPEYVAGTFVVPLVTFGYVFYGMHFILTTGIHLKNKSKYYPIFIILPAIANIILNAIFVPKYGMLAAATTTLVSFAFVALLTFVITQRIFPVKYAWNRIAVIGALFFPTILAFGAVLGTVQSIWPVLASDNLLAPLTCIQLLLPLPFLLILGYVLLRMNKLSIRSLPQAAKTLIGRA